MSKTVVIKLQSVGADVTGPFTVTDNLGNTVATNVSVATLISGASYTVADGAVSITLTSTAGCSISVTVYLSYITQSEIDSISVTYSATGSMWRHLTDVQTYNKFYGKVVPYIIEYPMIYKFQDEILQNVMDYTKVFKYLPIPDGVFNDNAQIQTDDQYFNKAILYNGQQCTGILNLIPKPLNNLQAYNQFPIYNADSKTILFTKSDNFYQYNTFWSIVSNKSLPLFNVSCESLSIDKVLNQSNMDYTTRSFTKSPLRAKDLKVRHILDNRSDAHMVSQFIITPSQISYK
jgi:hypothetical protein